MSFFKKIIKKRVRESIDRFISNKKIDFLKKLFDLTKIPKEELDRQYIDISRVRPFEGIWNPLSKNKEGKYIFENDERVTPVEEVKAAIENKYALEDWQFRIVRKHHDIQFCVCIANFPGAVKEIISDFEQMGYFLGISVNTTDPDGRVWANMQFEPKFQMDESREILYKGDLWHWTPKYNLEKILKRGLTPTSENSKFSYPNRIFLFVGDVPNVILDTFPKVLNDNNHDKRNIGEYVLLRVDSKKLLDNNYSFYYDGNMPCAVYTEQTIPSDFIKVTNEVKCR